jgi:hypothetical protein
VLILDGIPQFVQDAAHSSGEAARILAPTTTSAIRVLWDSTPNLPVVPVMTQLRTWWSGAALLINPLLPGEMTVANLDFDHNAPTTENQFFEQLEQAISNALYQTAYDYVIDLWSPLSVNIIIDDGTISLQGFGMIFGTDTFSGTFVLIDNVIEVSWFGAVPPIAIGGITFTGDEIHITLTDNMTLIFAYVAD